MEKFTYTRPHSLAEAVDLLSEPGVRNQILAGGTDLLVQIRQSPPTFDRLVDVNRIPELKLIEGDGRVTVGAGVTIAEILHNPILRERAPLLVEACGHIGSVQIRNVASIGGNVANAAPCADTLPPLVCLEAEALLVSAHGERRLPVWDLVTGPHQTSLRPGELIRSFTFAAQPLSSRSAFLRIGRRQAMAISRLAVAAIGKRDSSGMVTEIRLATGSAFSKFRRETEVEAMLLGQAAEEALIVAAGQEMTRLFEAESGKRWSAPYKRLALAALTERALRQVLGGER